MGKRMWGGIHTVCNIFSFEKKKSVSWVNIAIIVPELYRVSQLIWELRDDLKIVSDF